MSELLEPPHAARTETADPAVSPAPRRSARRRVRRLAVTVVGMTVLAFGVVLLVTPGPAIVIIPAGIAILATEYAWARRLMDRSKGY